MSQQELELPQGWRESNLDALSLIITKGSTPTSYGFSYQKTGINFKEKVSYPGLSIDKNSELVKLIKELLNKDKHKKVIFGTEGGLFQEKLNIPTVVCGPGNIDQAHKVNEYISIEQIIQGGEFLDNLINYSSG